LIALVALPLSTFGEATPYKELVKSKPVLINGLEFIAATEAQWLAFNPPTGRDPIEVQLWITNRTEKDLIFRVFDTFRIVIKDAFGNELVGDARRDGTLRTKPVLIHPGETYCLSHKGVLAWHPDGTRTFGYEDGTGSTCIWKLVFAGKYTLSFWVGNKQDDEGMKGFMRNHGFSGQLPPCWKGEGNTAEVPFEIVDPPPEHL
jgi:hypothetical protein